MWFLVVYARQPELGEEPSVGIAKSRRFKVLYGSERFIRRQFEELRLAPEVEAVEMVAGSEPVERGTKAICPGEPSDKFAVSEPPARDG